MRAISEATWSELVGAHPDSSIFHHPAWVRTLADVYGFVPLYLADGDEPSVIRGALPVMALASPLRGKRWVSLPFTDHCPPLLRTGESAESLAGRLVEHRGPGVRRIELRCDLRSASGFHSVPRYWLHQVHLDRGFDAAAARMHAMRRRNARTARARGLTVSRGTAREDMEAYYRLHVHTRRRQGVPVQPKRFFEAIHRRLLEPGLGFVALVHHGPRCVAGAICFTWNRTLTYKFGASLKDAFALRPNDPLFWTLIQWACESGCRVLDLGRTDFGHEGLRRYKLRWGAEEIPLVYSYFPKTPPESSRLAASTLAAVIRHSPQFVCRWIGKALYPLAG